MPLYAIMIRKISRQIYENGCRCEGYIFFFILVPDLIHFHLL